MSEGFVGADVEGLRSTSDRVSSHADMVQFVERESSNRIMRLAQIWMGPGADQFQSEWFGRHAPSLRNAAAHLEHAAAVLRANADAQAQTSAQLDQGGPVSGAVPGGSGGGTQPGAPTTEGQFGPMSFLSASWQLDNPRPRIAPFESGSGPVRDAGVSYQVEVTEGGVISNAEASFVGGYQGQFGGEVNLPFGSHIRRDAGFFIGAEGVARNNFSVGPDGIIFEQEFSASSGLTLDATGQVQLGDYYTGTVDAEVFAGGEFGVRHETHLDWDQFSSSGSVEAFLGVRAGFERSDSFWDGNIETGGGIGGRLGLGGDLSGGVDMGLDRVGVDVDLGFALGLGFDASVNVSVSPRDMWNDTSSFASTGAGHAVDGLEAVGGGIADTAGAVGSFFNPFD